MLGQILSGQKEPKSGIVTINHYQLYRHPIKARDQIGYLANSDSGEPFLTGAEFLDLVGAVYRLSPARRAARIEELVANLDLTADVYTTMERLSLGSRQKIVLAAALIHQPSCLILDEPLQYLDFDGQQRALELVNNAQKEGAAIILITDSLTLAEELADEIIILDNGRIAAQGTLKQLQNQAQPADRSLAGIYQAILEQ